MTLIAYSTDYGDHAEIITDTLAYTASSEELTHMTKQFALPHLDAVVIPHGDGDFGHHVVAQCLLESNHAGTFDLFAAATAEWLPALWERLERRLGRQIDLSQLHVIGYSESAGRFVAWRYTSSEGFTQQPAAGMQVYPAPWSMCPPPAERDAVAAALAGYPDGDEILRIWDAQPTPATPDAVPGWVELAETVRKERALEPFCRTPVGGRVIHTVLRRGRVITRTIHTYNDSGEEFAQLVSGTHHPVGLAGPCPCQSGRRFADCHARTEDGTADVQEDARQSAGV